jgi:teichuronic acid biosynthesis glycosyltransferase TuaG
MSTNASDHIATVSIIMPAYNAAFYIGEAIDSAFSQSGVYWELIIVDDGSTDETPALLAQIDDPRVKVRRQANTGVSAARNAALDVASGEFVTFLDADDLLPADALKRRVDYLRANPSVDIVNGKIRVTARGSTERIYNPLVNIEPLFPRLARLEESVFFGPFYMVRRASIGSHRFPVGISHCEDLIFLLELAHDVDLTYGAVDEVVYEYRRQPNSAMSNMSGLEEGYLTLLDRAARLDLITPEGLQDLRRRISSILLKSWIRRGRPLKAAKAYFNARYGSPVGLPRTA